MKRAMLLAIALFTIFNTDIVSECYGQETAPEIEWKVNVPNGLWDIISTQDNGYLLTGGIWKSPIHYVSLIKHDSSGVIQWEKTYGGNQNDRGNAIAESSIGEYAILATVRGNGTLIKVNKLGTMLWEKTFSREYASLESASLIWNNGWVILLNKSTGNDRYVSIIKISDIGSIEWEFLLSRGIGKNFYQTSDNGFVIVSILNYNICITKIDSEKNILWTNEYEHIGHEFNPYIIESEDNGYVVAARSITNENNEHVYIIKTNELGVLQWEKMYKRGGRVEVCNGLLHDYDNGFVFIHGGDGVGYLVKMDVLGNVVWEKPGSLEIQDFTKTRDRGYATYGCSSITNENRCETSSITKFSPSFPTPPENLLVSMRSDTASELHWNSDIPGAIQYIIERQLCQPGDAACWERLSEIPADRDTYIDAQLPPEQEVSYRMAVVTDSGTSPLSDSVSVNTPVQERWQLKIYDAKTNRWNDLLPGDGQFNPNAGTALIVHGWKPVPSEDPVNDWIRTMARTIFQRLNNNINIVAWDWMEEAQTAAVGRAVVRSTEEAKELSGLLKNIIRPGYSEPFQVLAHSAGQRIGSEALLQMIVVGTLSAENAHRYQLTLFDPFTPYITGVNKALRQLGVYIDLYDGLISEGTRNSHIRVNTPGWPFDHAVYNWYAQTIPDAYEIELHNRPFFCFGGTIPGTIGFDTSALVAPPGNTDAFRYIDPLCEEQGTLFFSRLSICSRLSNKNIFGLDKTENCDTAIPEPSLELERTTWLELTNELQGLRIKGDGGGAEFHEAVYEDEITISPEWDYVSFEYDFTHAPSPAVFSLSILDGEEETAYEMDSDLVFNEGFLVTGFYDIRKHQENIVTFRFSLSSEIPGSRVIVRSFSFWKDPYNGNSPPIAVAGDDIELDADPDNTAIVLFDGSASTDPDGDELTYRWMTEGGLIATGETSEAVLPAGKYAVTLVVTDIAGNTAIDDMSVIIRSVNISFLRGDSNADREIDISDAVKTLSFLFTGGTISCNDAADANDDGEVDISDPIFTLTFLFTDSSRPPPLPFPEPGLDPTEDELGCLSY